jgi:hypothetical protein
MKRTKEPGPTAFKAEADGETGTGAEQWVSMWIPGDREKVLELAAARGLLFEKSARNVASAYLEAVERRHRELVEHSIGNDEEEAETGELDKLQAKWATVQELLLKAVLPLTTGKGEAAQLARGAFADLLNVQEADRPTEALQAAFLAANAAARAYFVKHGKCEIKRKRTQAELVEAGQRILADMAKAGEVETNRDGTFQGLRSKGVQKAFFKRFEPLCKVSRPEADKVLRSIEDKQPSLTNKRKEAKRLNAKKAGN